MAGESSCAAVATHSKGVNMKMLLVCILFLMSTYLSSQTEPKKETTGGITVTLYDDTNGGTMPAITFDTTVSDVDKAIIEIQYWQDNIDYGRLLRTQTTVIPILLGTTVAADNVPVPPEKIERVTVTLVEQVQEAMFYF